MFNRYIPQATQQELIARIDVNIPSYEYITTSLVFQSSVHHPVEHCVGLVGCIRPCHACSVGFQCYMVMPRGDQREKAPTHFQPMKPIMFKLPARYSESRPGAPGAFLVSWQNKNTRDQSAGRDGFLRLVRGGCWRHTIKYCGP